MARRVSFNLRWVCVLVSTIGIAACATRQQQHPDANAFGSASYGENTVAGSASLVSRSGYVRTCDGNAVYLMPITTASTDLMVDLFGKASGGVGQRFKFEDRSNEIQHSGKQVECQRNGTFKFEHVADGNYYAVTDVTWLLRLTPEGAALGAIVQANGGQTTEVELRHQY